MILWVMRGCVALIVVLLVLVACSPPGADVPPQRLLVLSPAGLPVTQDMLAAVRQREAAPGRGTPGIEIHFAEVDSEAGVLEQVRARLARLDTYAAIFTPSQSWARAVQKIVPRTPIVFDGVDDPVEGCLVDSLLRPGRNATGHMHQLPDTEQKMLEVMRDGFPTLRELIVLVDGANLAKEVCYEGAPIQRPPMPACQPGLHEADALMQRLTDARGIAALGRGIGVAVRFLLLCRPEDFDLLPALRPASGTSVGCSCPGIRYLMTM